MMRINRALICAALTLAWAGGCVDQEAQNRQAIRLQFEQAVATLEAAERGFGDNKAPEAQTPDARALRLKQLTVAIQQLEPLVNQGPTNQQLIVRRLLASAHLAHARSQAQQATQAWTSLAGESGTLIGQVIALTQTDARAKFLQPHETDLIQNLQQFQAKTQEQLNSNQQLQQQLKASLQELSIEQARWIKDRDAAVTQAQNLRSQGFTKEGKEQFTLLQQALEAEGQSQIADSKAEQIQARLSILQAELAIAQIQAKHSTEAMTVVAQQLKAAEDRTKATNQLRDQTLTDEKDQASKKVQTQRLIEQFDRLTQAYTSQVDAPFTQAIQQSDKAIAYLEQANQMPGGDAAQRRQVSLELLAAYSAKAQMITRLVIAKGSLGQVLAVVANRAAANELLPERASYFADSAKQARENQVQTITAAKQVIQQGTELANKIQNASTSGQDDLLAFATAQIRLLDNCAKRIDQSRIPEKIVLPVIKP